MSQILFILMMEGLSCLLKNARSKVSLRGVSMEEILVITHLFFVDDILLFIDSSRWDAMNLKVILDIFVKAFAMDINDNKSSTYVKNVSPNSYEMLLATFEFKEVMMD